jgi:hypothetical protein
MNKLPDLSVSDNQNVNTATSIRLSGTSEYINFASLKDRV